MKQNEIRATSGPPQQTMYQMPSSVPLPNTGVINSPAALLWFTHGAPPCVSRHTAK